MLKRTSTKWTSLILIVSLLLTAIPPMTGFAAGERITITNLYKALSIVNDRPAASEDGNIHRYTTNPISITASLDGINASQIPNIFYEITNMNTGEVQTDPSNKAQSTGPYDIAFTSVNLTEGLNKVVLKLQGNVTISSEPRYVYFTPTTSIQDLKVDQVVWDETKIYPADPVSSTSVNVTGQAPNATDVLVKRLGDASPKTLFSSQGTFLLTGDDINKPTNPDFKFTPGDNFMTFTATNNAKTYTVEKNLVYDNGDPFAYNARIEGVVKDEAVVIPNPLSTKVYLDHMNVVNGSVEIYTAQNKGGTKLTNVTDYSYNTETSGANIGETYIVFNASGGASGDTRYVTYRTGGERLVNTPTIVVPNVRLNAYIKNDVDNVGTGEYRYLDVKLGGETFGPYDLSQYQAATQISGHYPGAIHVGHSQTHITLIGQALNDNTLRVTVENASGMNALAAADLGAPIATAETFSVFTLLSTDLTTAGNYTFKVRKADNTVIDQFNIAVTDPSGFTPAMIDTMTISLTDGYAAPATQTINLNATGYTASDFTIEVYTVNGSPLGTGSAKSIVGGTDDLTFSMPLGLPAGDYRIVVRHQDHEITNRHFVVASASATIPVVTGVADAIIPDFTGVLDGGGLQVLTPGYIIVNGTDFGTNLAAITGTPVLDGSTTDVNVVPYAIENTRAIFRVADTSALQDDADAVANADQAYTLNFTLKGTSLSAAFSSRRYIDNTVYALTTYEAQAITEIDRSEITATEALTPGLVPITLTGANLDQGQLQAKLTREDGAIVALADPTVTVNNATTATVTLPAGMATVNYILKIQVNNATGTPIVLGTYPLSVANPAWISLLPNNVPITDLGSTPITVIGSNLGRTPSNYTLRFVSDANGTSPATLTATRIESGSKLIFPNLPVNMSRGAYTATLQYIGQALTTDRAFTVASEPATLLENLQRSKAGQYKVFNFNVDVAIGTDLTQLVQFKFYNNANEARYSNFRFNYIDPNMPYVQQVRLKSGTNDLEGMPLTDVSSNEVNELPATFYVIADSNTEKVDVFLGDVDSNTVPLQTLAALGIGPTNYTVMPDGKHKFTFKLEGIPNGTHKLTVIPSTIASTAIPRSGQNIAGKKEIELVFTNTPYVIVNSLYSGMVIRNETELTCTALGGLPCISGRLINVPITNFADPSLAQAKVELFLNDSLVSNVTLTNPLVDSKFHVQVPIMEEGKNKFSLIVSLKQNGVFTKVTESIYEVFKFSTNAPEFLSVIPVEPFPDQVSFKKSANTTDTYSTTETTVSFTGQVANATELKLLVRRTKADGTSETIYDRRYSNFTQQDPITGNPNFLSINATTGLFSTVPILLSKTGDTTFEYTITNGSNVQVIKTVTINREALPYVVISPKLAENNKKQWQANINSNYYEIEIEAEGADRVVFGKDDAIERTKNVNGIDVQRFYYEVKNLKNGSNNIDFTVISGAEEIDGEFILFNANTNLEGAQFKTPLKATIKAFDGLVELKFPKATNFMRNDPNAINQFITADREILFGLANSADGRVDKYKHPATYDGQSGNPNPTIIPDAKFILAEPTGRFRSAGKLIWIDAGTIAQNEPNLKDAYSGGGKLPFDTTEYYNRTLKDLVVPTQRGELKLKYDNNIRGDAWKYLTVYHYDIFEDHSGVLKGRWRNIGGVVNTSANTITVPIERFGYYQVMYMSQSFDDVTAHPWARNSLDTLYSKGYMLPKQPPGLLVPNDPISRGEFATMLVKLFDIKLDYTESPTFTDVLRVNPLNNGLYDYKYIETAARAGIVRGMSGGRFQPDSAIKRQDAAVMISKAANMKLSTDENKSLTALQKLFTDANTTDSYARAAIEAVVKAKLMQGKENTLLQGQSKATFRYDPNEPITRAEAATIAINVLKQQKKIPK